MIARSVRRQRPQSAPAPQAAAICLDVDAPRWTAADTVWVVAPTHRQTYISTASHMPLSRSRPSHLLVGDGATTSHHS